MSLGSAVVLTISAFILQSRLASGHKVLAALDVWGTSALIYLTIMFALKEVLGIDTGAGYKPDFRSVKGALITFLLFPYRLVAWSLIWLFRAAGDNPIDKVGDKLFLSGRLVFVDKKRFDEAQIGGVIDVCAELPEWRRITADPSIKYLSLPIPDNCAPSQKQAEEAVAFARKLREEGRNVLVHCAYGHGRSAVAAAMILIDSGQADSPGEAERFLKKGRKAVDLSANQRAALIQWHNRAKNLDARA